MAHSMRQVAVIPLLGLISALAMGWWPGAATEAERFWPQWRGPHATGVAPFGDPPVEWSEARNVKWKVAIPGKGSSSPIVWGDRVFVTTAIPTGKKAEPPSEGVLSSLATRVRRFRMPGIDPTEVQRFAIFAIHRESGKILWQRTLREELPHEGTHLTGSWASSSPVTDGERVYAYFGSRGLYCLDWEGNLVWEKDLGDMTIKLSFGEGSSPFLYGDKIVLTWDHEGPSFTIALDKKTGKELWRASREERTSWASPVVVEHGGKPQVVTSATHRVRSYDLATGKLLWETTGMTRNAIPSPVASGGMVFVTSGFRGNALLAIRLDGAAGDITDSNSIAWKLDQDTPYAPSPLLYNGALYLLKSNSGILSCFNARTGQEYYRQKRLEGIGNVYSSPVGASGRVYVTDREGTTVVLERGPAFKVLGTNQLEDGFDASPAIVDEEIYLRGRRYLYRISEN